jgi:uncharacterized membrane protein
MPGNMWLIIVIMFMFLVLVLAAIAAGVWALSRSGILGGTAPERTVEPKLEPEDEALYVVRKRYALGEITRDEYEALRRDLET